MHPIFIGHGPAFKTNYVSSQFRIVDIYELMCHILDVKPAPNNGTFDNVKQVLKFNGANEATGVANAIENNYVMGKLFKKSIKWYESMTLTFCCRWIYISDMSCESRA